MMKPPSSRLAHVRRMWIAAAVFALLPSFASGEPDAATPSPGQLVASSVAHHDPQGRWPGGVFDLVLAFEPPPGGDTEPAGQEVRIDNARGRYEILRTSHGEPVRAALEADGSCSFEVAEAATNDPDVLSRHGLTCKKLLRRRNYHRYLWGQPMNLAAPGEIEGATVAAGTFQGHDVWTLRLQYEPPAGTDLWYFHFARSSRALVGYEFFKDEAERKGEYIVFEDEIEGAGLRLPQRRTWYQSWDDGLLGTDVLVSIEAGD